MKRILFVVLLVQCASLAAQSGTGAISGTAQDASGAVLPGVTVTLANPGTIGGNQVVVTDARGAYQFTRLVPGTYRVRGELEGFRAVVHENVVVSADVTARVDVRLEIGDIAETLTVTGQSPLIDTTSTLEQTSLDRATLATLPSRNDVWALARVAPGVILDRFDVGGTEGYNSSSVTVHGARGGEEGAFSIDGMDMGNGTGPMSPGMYLDPFGFEEANFQAGNAPAESARGGLVMNMVTRTGTNNFHGDFTMSGTNQHLQFENITSELLPDLLAAVPPRALAANPHLLPSAKVLSMFNSAANLSGPIVRDKLWFAATGDFGWLDQYQLGNYNPDGTRFVKDDRRYSYSYKLSWQMAPAHQLHFYDLIVQKDQLHRVTGGDLSTFWESVAANYQYPNLKRVQQLRWTGALSPRLLAEVGASYMRGPMINMPRPEVQRGDLPRFDRVTLVNSVARGRYNTHPQYRLNIKPSVSVVVANHHLKFGYELNRGLTNYHFFSMSHYPAGLRAIYRNGVPDSVNTYNTPTDYDLFVTEQGVYAQDSWQLRRKLTLNAGLRLEKVTGGSRELCQVQTIFIDGQCFPPIKNVPNFLNLSPRLGLIYDIFGNGTTALKLTANRYYLGIGNDFQNRINPIQAKNDTRTWIDRNNDLIPQLDELGPSSGFNLGTTNRYSEDLKRPYTNELSVGVEHQLPGGVAASVSYFRRVKRQVIGSRNLAVPPETYSALRVTEVSSGEQVTVYNQAPALRGKFDTLWDNYPEHDSDYNGVDVEVRKRLSNRWMMQGSMSVNRDTGDIYGADSDLNNPNFTFRHGVLQQDVPLMLKMSGLYELPYGISLSGIAQRYSGLPERQTVEVGRDTVTLTQVTQSVQIHPAGTTRRPAVTVFDLSVRKRFRIAGLTVEPVMDLYNVGNAHTILERATQLGPAYYRVSSIMPGRLLKFGLNVNF